MHILLNLVLFQVVWVSTVAGAAAGYWWLGPLVLLPFTAVVLRLSPWPRTDVALMCAACLVGVVVDSAYVQLGLMHFAEPVPFTGLAPIWILGMWMSFALTLNHSMRPFKAHLLWAGVFGLVGGPLAYWVAASKFNAVQMIGDPVWAYGTVGLAWALVTPGLLWLASTWLPYLDPPSAKER